MKFFHNEKLSLAWAIAVEIIVHALFAAGAFLLGAFLGDVALSQVVGVRLATAIGAWGLGLFIFGAAFQAFVYGEYMREHVESFETTEKGNGSYIRSWKQLRWLVAGLEIASLVFRCIVVIGQGDYLQAVIVTLFGGIALWYAYVQAKVIHASVNRPAEYDVMMAQQTIGKSLVTDSLKYTDKMSPEQKARFYTGDISAIQEVAENDFYSRQQKEQAKERKQAEKGRKEQEKAEKAERQKQNGERAGKASTRLLNPSTWTIGGKPRPKDNEDFIVAQMNNQDSHLSNGNRN